MKQLTFLFILIFFASQLIAQAAPIDSLNKLLATAKDDTTKVNALTKLSFYDQNFQHGLNLALKALELSRKINYKKGEADALHQVANQYQVISNYPRALYYFVEALKIRQSINDINGIGTSNEGIGYVYMAEGDYEKALKYYLKANSLFNNWYYRLAVLHSEIGALYILTDKQDSALKYFQSSYENFNKTNDKYQFGLTLLGLGQLQLNMGSKELALGYYHQAVKNAITYNDSLGLSYIYFNIAKYYEAEFQKDSCILYARKALFLAQRTVLENVIKSSKLLSKLYMNKDDKEALKYLQIAQTANDSLFSRERTMEIQNITFNEILRENELIEREKKQADQRKQNIQFTLIAFGIISFVIIFLIFSQSIVANEKLISFFGILGLLIVFEFANLSIHPWLAHITNESPVLMLLTLVLIGSLLIPLHHHLEKWIKEKMTEKNKAIRLAAAKKTIQQLGA